MASSGRDLSQTACEPSALTNSFASTCCTLHHHRRCVCSQSSIAMFSAALSAAGAKAPSAARGFASSASRMSGRKFFVGGNWKCNGSVAKVGPVEVSWWVSGSLAAERNAAVQVGFSDKTLESSDIPGRALESVVWICRNGDIHSFCALFGLARVERASVRQHKAMPPVIIAAEQPVLPHERPQAKHREP